MKNDLISRLRADAESTDDIGLCADAANEIERLSALCDKWNQECDELREDNKRQDKEISILWNSLENCRLLAARNRKQDWAIDIQRFCSAADVLAKTLR